MQQGLSGDAVDFALPPNMNIENIEAIANQLKNLVANKANITLDASNVENITTPGVQLVIALEKSLSAMGKFLTVMGGGEHFTAAFKDIGLESLISGGVKNG